MTIPYGRNLKLWVEGGSHDPYMEMRLDGFPAGMRVDMDALLRLMARRAPGQSGLTTGRKEKDIPEFLSGIREGVTDGNTIRAIIRNENQRPSDYHYNDTPRPSHADYAAVMKYGPEVDLRGGGHFSGRLTAMLCVAGGLCLQYLRERGISVFAHIASVGTVRDVPFAGMLRSEREKLENSAFSVLDEDAGGKMRALIASVKERGDSVGGVIECAVTGLPAGVGEHLFGGVEGSISGMLFSVPGVKGVEFGSGFSGAEKFGSEENDAFYTDGKNVYTKTNHCGGVLGGMTSGMPVVFRAAMKPTPSIAMEQDTVSLSRMENVKLTVGGRHDPCIVLRAVPVLEAAAGIAVCDMLWENGKIEVMTDKKVEGLEIEA